MPKTWSKRMTKTGMNSIVYEFSKIHHFGENLIYLSDKYRENGLLAGEKDEA